MLVPSLLLLFRLVLRGHLDPADTPSATVLPPHTPRKKQNHLLAAFAAATFLIGGGMTIIANSGWVLALGIICLFACAISTFGLATAEPAEKTITNPVFTAGD